MSKSSRGLGAALRAHWPEYLIEAALLGLFMISACLVGVLLDHPSSPIHQQVESPLLRRVIGGLAMGTTAISLFLSPWGKRSGAHMNPAVTLNFHLLGRVRREDAFWYILAQFAGGIAGVQLANVLLAAPLAHSAVDYVITRPGAAGELVAFAAEFVTSAGMAVAVLVTSNHRVLQRYTPWIAASLVAIYIVIEAPYSGMSMNPARTLGSAFAANEFHSIWIYFSAPVLGMIAAGQVFQRWHRVYCAKLQHQNNERCIFECAYKDLKIHESL